MKIRRSPLHPQRRRAAAMGLLLLVALAPGSHAAGGAAPLAESPAAGAPASLPSLLKLDKLTDEQLLRLRAVANGKGSSIALPPAVVAILHLPPAAVAPLVRQVTFQQEDGVKHGFARFNDDSGYLLFRKTSGNDLSVFRIDAAQKLVSAAHTFQGGRLIDLPAAEAQAGVDAELSAWSRVLSPRGVMLPPPNASVPVKP